MEQEARKVIPSKEEAARTGLKPEGEPLFADWSLGLRGGGGVYVAGYAKYFTAQLPALGASLHASLPKFGNLTAEFGLLSIGHRLKEGNDSVIQSLGVAGITSNYMASWGIGYRIPLMAKLYLEPQLGGGYVMQTTTVTGNGVNSTLNNGFPFVRAGFLNGYRINQTIDVTLSVESLAYIEQSVMTYVPLALVGIQYKF